MRMMMKIAIPFEAANRAVDDGSAQRILKRSLEELRPEAVYFYPADDGRTILLFLDVKEPSDLPPIGEPFFRGQSARVITFTPVMNLPDFMAGLAKAHPGRDPRPDGVSFSGGISASPPESSRHRAFPQPREG